MRSLLFGVVGMSLLFAACKKNDTPSLADNVWQFDDSVYKITKTFSGTGSDTSYFLGGETDVKGARESKLTFTFRSYPKSGSYTVSTIYPANSSFVNLDIEIGGQYYVATGVDGKPLNVTVTDNAVRLSTSNILVQNSNNSSDKTLISTNILIAK